jgi:nucleoside-diphosphate-sugar epimerase
MKKVFINGVAGLLGNHLAKNVEGGWIVAGNDNYIGADNTNLHDFADFLDIKCCDLNDMRKAMVDGDLVFQCAATSHEGLSVFAPSFITKNNYEASVSTFTTAINCGVKKLCFVHPWRAMAISLPHLLRTFVLSCRRLLITI